MERDEQPSYGEIKTGILQYLLGRIPRPVWAFGDRDLYRVLIEGADFILPIEGVASAMGFFTTRIVAAADVRQAQQAAKNAVLREWRRGGFHKLAGADPTLRIDEISILEERFLFHSHSGFVFFETVDDRAQ